MRTIGLIFEEPLPFTEAEPVEEPVAEAEPVEEPVAEAEPVEEPVAPKRRSTKKTK